MGHFKILIFAAVALQKSIIMNIFILNIITANPCFLPILKLLYCGYFDFNMSLPLNKIISRRNQGKITQSR